MEHLPPPKFQTSGSCNLIAKWREFTDEFDMWLTAVGKADASGEQKVALLLLSMGKEHKTVFKHTLTLTNDQRKDYDAVVGKFTDYFEPRKLKKGYITEFQSRKQQEGETLQHYITELRELAVLCEFGDSTNDQLSVQISNGVKDVRLREKLWSQDLELDDILKKCQQWDQKENVKHLYANTDEQVHAATTRKTNFNRGSNSRRRPPPPVRQQARNPAAEPRHGPTHNGHPPTTAEQQRRGRGRGSRSVTIINCTKCGRKHSIRQCPAYNKSCNLCGKLNHFARMCRTKSVHYADDDSFDQYDVHDVFENDDDNEIGSSQYVWYTDSDETSKPRWVIDFNTENNGTLTFKIDTAADVNVISKHAYESLKNKPNLCTSKSNIFGLGSQKLSPIGTCSIEITHNSVKHVLICEVVDAQVPNLLSLKDSIRLNLVKRVDSVDSQANFVLPDLLKKSVDQSTLKIIHEYSDVFSGVGKVPGEIELKVDPNFVPVANPPRPIPIALHDPVQLKLQALVDQGIIEKIPVGTPTPWCSALHIVPKKDGTVRITIDPKDLNAALLREFHPINTVEQVAQKCEKAQFFTVLDANQGYFQIQLDDESKNLTAFNTPFGRFRYRRLPMGIKSAPELFQRIFGDLFEGIDDLDIIVDDFLIQANSLEEHNATLKKTLQRAREKGVTFSLKKLQLCQPEVRYAGHKFTREGLKIDDEKIKAVIDMPEPQCIPDVERLLGMVTYVCKYLKNLSSITEPLRNLIKERREPMFTWHFDEVHREAVQKVKELMTSAPILKYYSMKDPVIISCDASQSGLGCVLLQNGKPVAFGSKALTSAEYAYAQIEKELLAIVFAFRKFHSYVYGRKDIVVETDHLPLIRIMEKPLHLVPLRLQKMRMRLQSYDFRLEAKRGTEIPVADALSRAFLNDTGPNLTDEKEHVFDVTVEEMSSIQRMSPPRVQEIRENTLKDEELQAVMKCIESGWPETRKEVDPVARVYFDYQEELWSLDGIVYKGERIVIPRSMRRKALEMLHESHQGIVKTKQLARDLIYWPGLNKQIEEMISRCSACQERRPAQASEPMISIPIPDTPWQHVAEDLFEVHGEKWLICVDYYSNYFEIEKLNSTDSEAVIRQSKKWFSTHGIPVEVTSDNGPPWNGQEWTRFAKVYGFKHTTISPKHSQSNGFVEKAVGIAKSMLIKCQKTNSDPYLALLNIRNTPREDVTGSPAQRLFSRRTSTRIPTAQKKLVPETKNPEVVKKKLEESRQQTKKRYDIHTRQLKPLRTDDTIRVRVGRNWKPARLLRDQDQLPPRSYRIELPSGRITRRNRKDLLKTNEKNIFQPEEPPDHEHDEWLPSPGTSVAQRNASANPSSPNLIPSTYPNSPTTSSPDRLQNAPIPDKQATTQKTPVITRFGRVSKPPKHLSDYVV